LLANMFATFRSAIFFLFLHVYFATKKLYTVGPKAHFLQRFKSHATRMAENILFSDLVFNTVGFFCTTLLE
jgi:hypothetical protein